MASPFNECDQRNDFEAATGLNATEWIAEECRRTSIEARATVRFAKRLALTDGVRAGLADGRVSLGQAQLFTNVLTKRTAEWFAAHEDFLLRNVARLSTNQAEKVLANWYRHADAATDRKARADVETRRELFLSAVGDSEWALKGTLTPEQGELMMTFPTFSGVG